RGIATIEPNGQREMIIITELPYQVNKARLIEKMADLVKDKKIEDISDIRDESDRMGIRVVVELKKDANSAVVLNKLYKYTQLEESFGVNMLALVDGEPKVLNLHAMLHHYLKHQKEVVTRRTQFNLDRAAKRAHILEGLLIALDHIDEVISIVRSSKERAEARQRLQERFGLSEEQATAIGDMRIIQLTGLEREKLENEYNELQELIKELRAILDDEKLLYGVIREEILIVRSKYADERRTALLIDPGEIDYDDLIDEETCVITMSHLGYIKRIPLSTYRSQNRGGKGIIGMQTREEDYVHDVFIASTHDHMLFFTNKGRVYSMRGYEIPSSGRTSRGMALVNLLNLGGGEKVTTIIPVKEFAADQYVVMVTKKGLIKKTALALFSNIRKTGIIALSFRDDDELIAVRRTDGSREIFVATSGGKGLRFCESEVRGMGRTASGVRAIRLSGGDEIVSADILDEDSKILFVSERGYGKCTDKEEFTLRHRGGGGVRMYRITEKTGQVMAVAKAHDGEELMIITSEGVIIRIRISDISTQSRVTQGVKLIGLDENVTVVGIARIAEDYLDSDERGDEEGDSEEEINEN
ncbi:MAG: DNA gyrase subunit A, partial [Defluviitaleaceae bacterium]|nr:DNA gyrase subunit A [Defluviitaleaceae bacterium]